MASPASFVRRAMAIGAWACRGLARSPILAGPLGARYTGGMDTPGKRRRFFPTPAWLVLGSLAATGLLFLSERWRWFPFNAHKGWTVLIAVAAVGVVLASMLLWWLVALVFRSRFQFGIRTLLVLVVAVALPFSWLAVEMKKAREQGAAIAAIGKLDGRIYCDWHFDANGKRIFNAQPPERMLLLSLLGDDFFQSVRIVNLRATQVADAGLELLKGVSQLRALTLRDTHVTDAGLHHLKGLGQLQTLDLSGTHVTDAGLHHLKGLGQLQTLDLSGTHVTDAGLHHLKGLGQLQTLDLSGTHVTDAGLEHLKGLGQLECLGLDNTQITGAGLNHLKGLGQLKVLRLTHTPVTDAGLKHLEALGQLQTLCLEGTHITDAGLELIKGLTQLRVLSFGGTHVSNAGLERLQEALPQCELDLSYGYPH